MNFPCEQAPLTVEEYQQADQYRQSALKECRGYLRMRIATWLSTAAGTLATLWCAENQQVAGTLFLSLATADAFRYVTFSLGPKHRKVRAQIDACEQLMENFQRDHGLETRYLLEEKMWLKDERPDFLLP